LAKNQQLLTEHQIPRRKILRGRAGRPPTQCPAPSVEKLRMTVANPGSLPRRPSPWAQQDGASNPENAPIATQVKAGLDSRVREEALAITPSLASVPIGAAGGGTPSPRSGPRSGHRFGRLRRGSVRISS
jgi:hypothetical protein